MRDLGVCGNYSKFNVVQKHIYIVKLSVSFYSQLNNMNPEGFERNDALK